MRVLSAFYFVFDRKRESFKASFHKDKRQGFVGHNIFGRTFSDLTDFEVHRLKLYPTNELQETLFLSSSKRGVIWPSWFGRLGPGE